MPYQPETWNIIDAAIVGHKIAKFKFNDLKQNKKNGLSLLSLSLFFPHIEQKNRNLKNCTWSIL